MEEKLLLIAHAPNQKLQLEVFQTEKEIPLFRVLYDGTAVLTVSDLWPIIKLGDLSLDSISEVRHLQDSGSKIFAVNPIVRPLPFGGSEIEITLSSDDYGAIIIRVIIKDDALAIRYENSGELSNENLFLDQTTFQIGVDASAISTYPAIGLHPDEAVQLPALFELDNGLYMSLNRISNPKNCIELVRGEGRRLMASIPLYFSDSTSSTPYNDFGWWVISFAHP